MPSHFSPNSLKTKKSGTGEVSHFFKTGLPVSTASRAWEISPLGSPISRLAFLADAKTATPAALKAAALHLDLGQGARLKDGRYNGNSGRSEQRPYEGNGKAKMPAFRRPLQGQRQDYGEPAEPGMKIEV